MSDESPGQLCLFPKGRNQGPAGLHAPQPAAGEAAEVCAVPRIENSQLILFAVAPHILHRVEFRPAGMPVGACGRWPRPTGAPIGCSAVAPIPDEEQLARKLPPQVALSTILDS